MPAGFRRHLAGKLRKMLVTVIALKYAYW